MSMILNKNKILKNLPERKEEQEAQHGISLPEETTLQPVIYVKLGYQQ